MRVVIGSDIGDALPEGVLRGSKKAALGDVRPIFSGFLVT
jgi:hypothetical protein